MCSNQANCILGLNDPGGQECLGFSDLGQSILFLGLSDRREITGWGGVVGAECRIDAPNASIRLASLSGEGQECWAFPQSSYACPSLLREVRVP